MYTIRLLDIAIEELQEAFNWYQEQRPDLGYDLIDEVNDYLKQVELNPHQFVVKFAKRYHHATLKIFPYQIIYRVDENKKLVQVYSIFHTSRRPKRYKK
ncbi:hypothetical protein BEL04_13310 [Mucilaginibacter sp. PPCGB 2223]|uniref:type II toxin-antitoxin system RelE/ParE family toxin n=1 Tax=Mucilaginibacter sp. PPCGB 2223 TaxID=1886027 RepID=UPI000826AA69|nr:type II toxin-antitoxin system RelE/ParE family toxin [Mucilaginibacter sp. PPCGB 2223]OCX52436.1 hypothetical protein BEL04_13310 [Mucilaginibacter sp. PPCGB 2223]